MALHIKFIIAVFFVHGMVINTAPPAGASDYENAWLLPGL